MAEDEIENPTVKSKRQRVFAVVEKIFVLVLLVLLVQVGLGHVTNGGNKPDAPTALKIEKLYIVKQDGMRHLFEVEIADTTEARNRGLMFRKSMEPDHGMLFVFPRVAEQSFWMRNTYIPLDMIFVKEDGAIHRIHENAIPEDLTHIPSQGPIQAVFELNGGRSGELGLQVGDKIHHKIFRNELAE